MKLDELLKRLAGLQIYVVEDRRLADTGRRVIFFRTKLPEIPYGHDKHCWANIVLALDSDFVEREEIDSILRHLGHGSAVIVGDEWDRELIPTDPHEKEISDLVDLRLAASNERPDVDSCALEISARVGFSLSECETEYLKLCLMYRGLELEIDRRD